ncbi:MAG TPA: PilZ domain-containing protein [Parvularculaceae bacterium]|nr:PilZ domain-containing protein [Parvularculaceae bacterium]HNS86242.1 PilZ domain-containing protein [Parvularculaceae bacterium]
MDTTIGKKPGAAPTGATPEPSDDERRRHRRVDLTLKARVLKGDGEEEPCLVINISAGGALLKAVNPPQAGEKVVVYIDTVGRHEGLVIRSSKHHFAVDYRGRRAKSKRAADQITYAVNNPHMRLERRQNPRIGTEEPTVLTLENGESFACEMLDISLTGASIAIDPKPELGAVVHIGRTKAKVVRRHEKGVGLVFLGAAEKMEDVIKNAKSPIETQPVGAGLAPQFGKKGASG